MQIIKKCPECGYEEKMYKNPFPTADIIIKIYENSIFTGIVLIKRGKKPFGWALPGGFIDYGESAEDAAAREAFEETNLKIRNLKQFGVYSDPDRDPRFHTLTVVFTAEADDIPVAADDAAEAKIFTKKEIPENMAFDHRKIIDNFFEQEKL